MRGREGVTPLRRFLTDDRSFTASPIDAYSQAWALAFYLSERRSSEFTDYLEAVRSRSPFAEYTGEERLADFRNCFGDDVDWIEVRWLRFMDDL